MPEKTVRYTLVNVGKVTPYEVRLVDELGLGVVHESVSELNEKLLKGLRVELQYGGSEQDGTLYHLKCGDLSVGTVTLQHID